MCSITTSRGAFFPLASGKKSLSLKSIFRSFLARRHLQGSTYVEGKKPRHLGLFEAAFPRGGSSEKEASDNVDLCRPRGFNCLVVSLFQWLVKFRQWYCFRSFLGLRVRLSRVLILRNKMYLTFNVRFT